MSPKSRIQNRVLQPTTASARTSSTLSATPVYRAGQTTQQIHFPGRKRVVKKYGKGNQKPSPRQRTLTQIGYIFHPPQHVILQGVGLEADADGGPQPSLEVDTDANAGVHGNRAMLNQKQQPRHTTPEKRWSSAAYDTAQSAFTTPATGRTEIPSSQPSPFTPILLPDSCQSPLSGPQSSPLPDKGLDLFSGCGLDAAGVVRNSKDHAGHLSKRRKPSPALESQFSFANLNPDSKTTCSSQERSQIEYLTSCGSVLRSSSQERLGCGAALNKVCSSQGDGAKTPITHDLMTRASQRLISSPGPAEEIPDTDDEEDEGKAYVRFVLRNPAAAPQHTVGIAGSNGIFSDSPLSSSDPSAPSVSEPITPTTRLREKRVSTVRRIQVNQVGHSAVIERDRTRTASRSAFQRKMDVAAIFRKAEGDETRSTPPNVAKCNGLRTVHDFGPSLRGQLFGKQQDVQSQGLESQRVPLDVISRFEPHTDRSDIIICTDPAQAQGMVDGTRGYELRNFKIPHTVCRFWIYVTEPICELRYMAVVAAGFQQASTMDNRGGTGDPPPNAGSMANLFAYRLLQVYQLNDPVPLSTMKKNGWMDGPPARYTYIPPAVVGSLLGNLRCAVVDNAQGGGVCLDDVLSVRQGVEAQHAGDVTDTQSLLGQALPVFAGHRQQSAVGCTSTALVDRAIVSAAVAKGGHRKAAQCRQTRASQAITGGASAAHVPTVPTGTSQDTRSAPTMAWLDEPVPFAASSKGDNTLDFEDAQEAAAVAGTNRALQARRRRKAQHGFQYQQLAFSAAGVSQLDLPDSLYEEMRQAPPAVVLDSEDSEDE